MGTNGEFAIYVRGLRKSYGDFEAVKGIDFEVRAGEVFGLLGPNGAGKTTTVEILEGLRPRSAGEVKVLGLDPDRQKQAAQGSNRRLPPGHESSRQNHRARSPRFLWLTLFPQSRHRYACSSDFN